MASGGDLFLGLDVGTQSTKALVYDAATGDVVERSQVTYDLIEGLPAGHAEQQPEMWLEAVVEAVGALDRRGEIRGIGVSGQQHGAVLLGEQYEVVRAAKLWCDTSTSEEAAALSAELGRSVPAGFTAPKLRYVAEREPDVWARTRHVVLPHDFINACLCHDLFTEAGDASGTGYLDPRTGRYDEDAVARTAPGLAEKLPPIVATGAVAGRLVESTAQRLGLTAGIPVSAGGGDNMMSAIGAGATGPGVVVCSLGTSATVFAFTGAPLLDPEGLIADFRASSVMPGTAEPGHLPLLCVMNCTEPLEAIRELTGRGHDELTALARAVPPGAEGVTFVPFLVGERVPNMPNARGTLTGLGANGLDAGVLYRAALEGVAMNLASGLDRMRGLGLDVAEVRLVGGAARNALWAEILAACFGAAVRPMAETETAALGAAMQAAAAARGVDPGTLPRSGGEGEAVTASTALADAYAALRPRFAAEVEAAGHRRE